jgi:hypothetical protein
VRGDVTNYPVEELKAGWYVNRGATATTSHPAGLRYAQVLRAAARLPDPDWLHAAAQANGLSGQYTLPTPPIDLAVGEDLSVQAAVSDVAPGLYTLSATIDPHGQVNESREDNNHLETHLTPWTDVYYLPLTTMGTTLP